MLLFDSKVAENSFNLLRKINSVSSNMNSELDFDKLDEDEKNILLLNPELKKSVFVRYLPLQFVLQIKNTSTCESILHIYRTNQINSNLKWTTEMKTLLCSTLNERITNLEVEIEKFGENDILHRSIEKIPIYSNQLSGIIMYPLQTDEVRCAGVYLNKWVLEPMYDESGPNQDIFIAEIEKLVEAVSKECQKRSSTYIDILLKAAYLLFRKYSAKKMSLIPSIHQLILQYTQKQSKFTLHHLILKRCIKLFVLYVIDSLGKTIQREGSYPTNYRSYFRLH
jgi:hypothetical protein